MACNWDLIFALQPAVPLLECINIRRWFKGASQDLMTMNHKELEMSKLIFRIDLTPRMKTISYLQCPIILMHAPSNSKFTICNLQHWFQVIGNLEGCLGLGLDFFNSHPVSDLDQGETIRKVNVKDTEVGDYTADAGRAGQRELALLDNLGIALLVGMLHGHNDLGGRGVGDQVHGTAEALNLTGKHP